MNRSEILKFISEDRFRPYLLKCDGDLALAFKLYENNIIISQSFYALLSVLEVTLRNKIDLCFKKHFCNEFWLGGELPEEIAKHVRGVEQKLLKNKRSISNSSILSELNFGFWTILLNRSFAKKYWKPLHKVFEHIPKDQRKRARISSKLNHIRIFRNRIYHYEPVIWNMEVLDQKHVDIFEVLYWLNPETAEWASHIDTYEEIKSRIQHVKFKSG